MTYTIIVATHKPYQMPQDPCYLPLHVGKAGKQDLGFAGDDTGENISTKNPYYCELTGLYWLWKNNQSDYKGLVHYRRHFGSGVKSKDPWERILNQTQLERLLTTSDILLPRKRRYYIETLYSHYSNTHYREHLDLTRAIIGEQCPQYLDAFDRVMKRTWGHMFNMFIMSAEKSDAYCAWLFPILEQLEDRVDYKSLDPFQARLFGRVSELLLDVWLETQGYSYQELPLVSPEPVNWWRKGTSFLRAKFCKRKYQGSF
ncbi:DUF4422 domain-containing protein [Pseudoflavonifractor capillosus]|uniref:DUF4422 domain-containing protein n=1 Tax=Pseudoflavonifractor capillosus TaxID=106588 RepID=UPI0019586E12|nr:DUF4422 domain-containing protein [Pseudoflavonifractor capillosus]MBM6896599.1 DUF4422 domain-containing protein [Pseudoflavonifractor capillosus]